jgi:hypothetical protein
MATLSSLILLDTSIFVDYLRNGLHEDRIDSLTGVPSYKAARSLNLEIW